MERNLFDFLHSPPISNTTVQLDSSFTVYTHWHVLHYSAYMVLPVVYYSMFWFCSRKDFIYKVCVETRIVGKSMEFPLFF